MSSTEHVRKALACTFPLVAVKGVLDALLTLQARLDAGEVTPASYGVCSALDRILQRDSAEYLDPYQFVHIAALDWSEAIRNENGKVACYPVSTSGGFWVGENRAARIRLIEHLVQHCEALIAEQA